MKKILVAALLSAVVATPAFAGDSGGYVGVTVGRSKMDNRYTATTTTKDTDTIGSILLGYQYDRNWGVELFYSGVGRLEGAYTGGTYTVKGDAVGFNVVGTLPIDSTFALYGKLGFASTKTEVSSSTAIAGFTGDRRSAATGGVGGQYNVSKDVGIRFGWDGFELSTRGGQDKLRSNVWSMGAVFKF